MIRIRKSRTLEAQAREHSELKERCSRLESDLKYAEEKIRQLQANYMACSQLLAANLWAAHRTYRDISSKDVEYAQRFDIGVQERKNGTVRITLIQKPEQKKEDDKSDG